MAIHRRRFSGRRSSGRKARRSYWLGASLQAVAVPMQPGSLGAGSPTFGDVVTAWSAWPSDTENYEGDIQAADRTVVRTIINAQIKSPQRIGPTANDTLQACLGLIAWDHPDPVQLDGIQLGAGVVPDPVLQPDADWLIRLPFCFAQFNQLQGPGDATFLVSRAMRKLPPMTGILAIFSWATGAPSSLGQEDWWFVWDVRHAMKSGYSK